MEYLKRIDAAFALAVRTVPVPPLTSEAKAWTRRQAGVTDADVKAVRDLANDRAVREFRAYLAAHCRCVRVGGGTLLVAVDESEPWFIAELELRRYSVFPELLKLLKPHSLDDIVWFAIAPKRLVAFDNDDDYEPPI
jgi:hypothetical protein